MPIVVAAVWLWLTRRAVQHRHGAPHDHAADAEAGTVRSPGSPSCAVAGCLRPAGPLGRCLPHS